MSRPAEQDPEVTIRLLQQELSDTNREVLALTLELERRVEQRTTELCAAQRELQRTNSELLNLTLELDDRVTKRTRELEEVNQALRQEVTDRRQLQARLQAQLSRMELLGRITRAITERQDLNSISQVAVENLEAELPVDFACVCRYDAGSAELAVSCIGPRSLTAASKLTLLESVGIPVDPNGLSRCVAGELVYEPDTTQITWPFARKFAACDLSAVVFAPVAVEEEIFGVLIAGRHTSHSFTSGDCEFLRQLSEHVGLAAHQSQLYGALRQAYDDLRVTQQAVTQQERLQALGQMASGIAHDINNAISPVALYVESLLEREPNLSPRARKYLQTIQRSIDDVSTTVSRLREFYRQREPQLTLAPVNANELIQHAIDMTRARWFDIPQQRGIVIDVRTELASDVPAVMGVESEIREALVNLIFNAVDAMPEGGTLILRTRVSPGVASANQPDSVHLEVSDTGIGMDEHTRCRCVEPFFTTKGERGTGLGLAMVFGVVERHSGDIEIESTPGEGTTVRLTFSVASGTAGLIHAVAVAAKPPSLRILLVDDDPLLLKSLREALEADGHVVSVANNGEAGIEAFRAGRQRNEPFSVVITDLGMPYIDGRKVARAVKTASPSTPVILLTGWGNRMGVEEDIPPHVNRVLSKPPKLGGLREALLQCCPPENKPALRTRRNNGA